MTDVLQLVGAVLILVPFSAVQLKRMSPASAPYLTLNVVGAGLLAVLALIDSQWGFLLLESVWTLVSAWGLMEIARRRSVAGAH